MSSRNSSRSHRRRYKRHCENCEEGWGPLTMTCPRCLRWTPARKWLTILVASLAFIALLKALELI